MRSNFAACVGISAFALLLGVALLAGAISSQRRTAAELEAAERAHALSLETDGAPAPAAAPARPATRVPGAVAAAPTSRPAETTAFPWTPGIADATRSSNGSLVNARPAHAAASATTRDKWVQPLSEAREKGSDSPPSIPTSASFPQNQGLWKDSGHGSWPPPGASAGTRAPTPVGSGNTHAPPRPSHSRRSPSLSEARHAMHPRLR